VKAEALKDKIIFSLSQQRGFGNPEWIMQIALDPKESIDMRKQALFWAGQNDGASTEAFANLYDKMTDSEIKEQLIFVLSQRGRDGKALEKLMDIAKSDKDKELRSGRVLAGQCGTRAAKFLKTLSRKRSSRRPQPDAHTAAVAAAVMAAALASPPSRSRIARRR
jgi:hypothetical protein